MCLLLGSPIWHLLFHCFARSIPDHPISLKLAWELEIGVSIMLWAFLYVAGTSCILLLVCAQSPEVYIVKGGMSSVSALKSIEYRPACFLSLQTSCATLLPASIAQVLVTSRLAPHFTVTPSQQDGSQLKYKSVSELKKVNPFQVMEADQTKKASCC